MTASTLSLSGWLLERIAEDEAEVQDVIPPITVMYDYEVKWQPRRVKAECAAKRAIVELHTGENDTRCQSWNGNWAYEPCETLRALAAVYADHEDYRDEWRP